LNNSISVTYAGGWTEFHPFGHKPLGLQLCIQPAPAQNMYAATKITISKMYHLLHQHYQLMSGLYMPLPESNTHTYPMGNIQLD